LNSRPRPHPNPRPTPLPRAPSPLAPTQPRSPPPKQEDIRFKNYPVVTGWPHVRFYAAAPLVAPGGQRLGTLCVLDYKPRTFSAENAQLLAQLSGMVMREVERKVRAGWEGGAGGRGGGALGGLRSCSRARRGQRRAAGRG
jgi:hypothetical protein